MNEFCDFGRLGYNGIMKQTQLGIGIIGAGAIGKAIGSLFAQAGHPPAYWDSNAAECTAGSLTELANGAQIIFLCVPSQANAAVAGEISAAINEGPRRLVISMAKGVGPGFVTMDRLLESAAGGKFDTGLLYGPMLAEEVTRTGRAAGALAVSSPRWNGCLEEWLSDRVNIEYTTDQRSVALCGALKNIYAPAFGLCDGLRLGNNAKGQLMVMVLREMKTAVTALGGRETVAEGLAGLGDLLATGWSELSHNYRTGKGLAEGTPEAGMLKGEGVNSLREIPAVLSLDKYPVLAAMHAIMFEDTAPRSLENVFEADR
jgi:glycerol-3-phosphate dehydrogenase (NAD(P)+)